MRRLNEDEAAFSSKAARGKIVRMGYLIDLAMSLTITLGAAISTFVEDLRDVADDNALIFWILTIVTGVAGAVTFLCLSTISAARGKYPLNILLLLATILLMAVGFFCFSAVADIGVGLAIVLAPQIFMVCVIIMSFFLEVASYPMYMVSLILVMTPLVGAFVHLYIEDQIHLYYLIIGPIVSFVLCVDLTASTVWSLSTTQETGLGEKDYVQEAVYILIGKMPSCRCCAKKDEAR